MKVVVIAVLSALFGLGLVVGLVPRASEPARQIDAAPACALRFDEAIRLVLERSQELAIEQRRSLQAQAVSRATG